MKTKKHKEGTRGKLNYFIIIMIIIIIIVINYFIRRSSNHRIHFSSS